MYLEWFFRSKLNAINAIKMINFPKNNIFCYVWILVSNGKRRNYRNSILNSNTPSTILPPSTKTSTITTGTETSTTSTKSINNCNNLTETWTTSTMTTAGTSALKTLTRGQFHQHFMSSFFVWKSFEQLFCTYVLGLYIFVERKLEQMLLVKCWWNWPLGNKTV